MSGGMNLTRVSTVAMMSIKGIGLTLIRKSSQLIRKNNYKPPRKSQRRKVMNPKKHTTSKRDQIAENSDSDQFLAKRNTPTWSDSEPESPTEYAEPIFHITGDGEISKDGEHFKHICPVCENALSSMLPGYYSYLEDETEHPKLPEVAFLPGGHAFHSECLMQFIEEQQSREPPCYICISLSDY